MGFRHPWRAYQQRVLEEFDRHLEDRHFHVVAAPGSGKTILGLELLRRIGRPALVFAPSLTVRDQWVQRFLDGFMAGAGQPAWVSTHLENIQRLTVTTYQALHAFERRDGLKELIARCHQAEIRTLVFDEAHHLRNEWWRSLADLKAALEAPFAVALTATPPYDVGRVEWSRYATLCGAVDVEISAPELVKAGNLCPHQDFIYLTTPTASEQARLQRFDLTTRGILTDLALDQEIVETVRRHPVLAAPSAHTDVLLKDSDYFLSLAVFLRHATGLAPRALMEHLGLDEIELPEFHRGWAEVFLQGLLYRHKADHTGAAESLRALQQRLKACEAINRNHVELTCSAHNNRLLRASPAKLHAITDVVEHESRLLGWKLRAVILTDYIREEEFPDPDGIGREATRVGVVPIFEHLRRLKLPAVRLGIATGRLVVVPAPVADRFLTLAHETGAGEVQLEPLWHDAQYLRVRPCGSDGSTLLAALTQLLSDGEINVLVGTAALLGEGWDAPAVNTLVMATTIGTYVTSNQMRGRAIRTDPDQPYKSANIWHVACLVPSTEQPSVKHSDNCPVATDDSDISLLQRRFEGFVGLHHQEPAIESGLARVGALNNPAISAHVADWNAGMCRAAERRDELADRWRMAIHHPTHRIQRVVDELLVPIPRLPSHPIMRHWGLANEPWLPWLRDWLLARRMRRIALAVLRPLREFGLISSEISERQLEVRMRRHHAAVRLLHVQVRDEMILVESLRELFDPLAPARYLLVQPLDIFVVPSLLADRKDRAERTAASWAHSVGPTQLVYVHTRQGKETLLKAREKHLTQKYREPVLRQRRWS